MKKKRDNMNPATTIQSNHQFKKTTMGKRFLTLGVGLVLVTATAFSSRAVGSQMVQLNARVPRLVAQMKAIATLPADTNLSLAIGLPLRNREELTNLLAQIYDPSSTNYHHYLTPEQFTEKFGPTERDYAMVANFARVNGLTITHTHANRMVLDVKAKASAVEKAFHVKLQTYKHPREDRNFFAPDKEPTVDAALPILSVQGMNNYQVPRPMMKPIVSPGAVPANGSGLGGSYIGQDFRNAYVPGSNLRGSGQVVGLMQFDGYFASDIETYMSRAGMTNVPLENVLLDGFDGVPVFLDGEGEVCLDIDMCISMAPSLAKVVVFEAGPFGNPNDILSSMAARTEIKQLSASWGYPTDATTEQLYQQLALQGQTFLNCSGDGDAWVGGILFGSCESANITIVGGTTLTMNGVGASYSSEQVWNSGYLGFNNWNVDGYWGSSGGISTTVPIPSWQQDINMTTNHGSTTFRNVPDIALTADNVFLVYGGGLEGISGGTSAATPLWAGFMALVNQQAVANGKSSIGFLAPTVYALSKTAGYTNDFHDITVGDNTWPQSPTNFLAVPGYDLATGLGTPNGTNLINALAAPGVTNPVVHITPPPPPYGTTLANLSGGNPNGTWQLFVQDDAAFNTGIISNGWYLTLTTANPVGFSANLSLAMTAMPSSGVLLSNYLTYSLTVTNYGPSTSSNVLVSDTLPLGVTLVSVTNSQGSMNGLNWNVGSLESGAGAKLALTVQPITTGNLLNYATATAVTPDANTGDNTASVTINVQVPTPPQLSSAYVGADGSFRFSVTGTPGVTNVIQASTNLVNWVNIYTNVSPFNYTNMNTGSYPQQFYRAIAP
jgi:uncharacterized repeat protein (TIGR01451 family)